MNGETIDSKSPLSGLRGAKPQSKAAKIRALTKGDDTTNNAPGATAMQVKK